MPKTDLEIRGGGGGCWERSPKNFFWPFGLTLVARGFSAWRGPQFGLKIRGLPGPLPWIPQSKCIMLDCSSFTIIVIERKAKLH